MKDYLSFWGKARSHSDATHPWHSIAYHSLDVAACGRTLLEQHNLWRIRLSDSLELSGQDLLAFITLLLVLHDLG
jgi:CRISPR-associated endonuclease/helicase Cas3